MSAEEKFTYQDLQAFKKVQRILADESGQEQEKGPVKEASKEEVDAIFGPLTGEEKKKKEPDPDDVLDQVMGMYGYN